MGGEGELQNSGNFSLNMARSSLSSLGLSKRGARCLCWGVRRERDEKELGCGALLHSFPSVDMQGDLPYIRALVCVMDHKLRGPAFLPAAQLVFPHCHQWDLCHQKARGKGRRGLTSWEGNLADAGAACRLEHHEQGCSIQLRDQKGLGTFLFI